MAQLGGQVKQWRYAILLYLGIFIYPAYSQPLYPLPDTNGLDNEQLAYAASESAKQECTVQRQLNHQWMAVGLREQKVKHGSRVLRHFIKTAAKSYWKQRKGGDIQLVSENNQYKQDSNNKEYDLHLSSDSAEFSFEYEFF